MLKELSLLKWQEKATNLASEDNATKILELQTNVSNLEENLKTERSSPDNLYQFAWFLPHSALDNRITFIFQGENSREQQEIEGTRGVALEVH